MNTENPRNYSGVQKCSIHVHAGYNLVPNAALHVLNVLSTRSIIQLLVLVIRSTQA